MSPRDEIDIFVVLRHRYLSAVYGYPTLTSDQDHIVAVINEFTECIFKVVYMGAHLVEFFPWLRHLPSR